MENEKIMIAAADCGFLANLVQSYTSGSKTVLAVNGKITPSGSYATLNEWARSIGSTPLDSAVPTVTLTFTLIILVDTFLKHTVLIAKNLSEATFLQQVSKLQSTKLSDK